MTSSVQTNCSSVPLSSKEDENPSVSLSPNGKRDVLLSPIQDHSCSKGGKDDLFPFPSRTEVCSFLYPYRKRSRTSFIKRAYSLDDIAELSKLSPLVEFCKRCEPIQYSQLLAEAKYTISPNEELIIDLNTFNPSRRTPLFAPVSKAAHSLDTIGELSPIYLKTFTHYRTIMENRVLTKNRRDASNIDLISLFIALKKTQHLNLLQAEKQLYEAMRVSSRSPNTQSSTHRRKLLYNNLTFKLKSLLSVYPHLSYYCNGCLRKWNVHSIRQVPEVLLFINEPTIKQRFIESSTALPEEDN